MLVALLFSLALKLGPVDVLPLPLPSPLPFLFIPFPSFPSFPLSMFSSSRLAGDSGATVGSNGGLSSSSETRGSAAEAEAPEPSEVAMGASSMWSATGMKCSCCSRPSLPNGDFSELTKADKRGKRQRKKGLAATSNAC